MLKPITDAQERIIFRNSERSRRKASRDIMFEEISVAAQLQLMIKDITRDEALREAARIVAKWNNS
jgi:hypothetical protein